MNFCCYGIVFLTVLSKHVLFQCVGVSELPVALFAWVRVLVEVDAAMTVEVLRVREPGSAFRALVRLFACKYIRRLLDLSSRSLCYLMSEKFVQRISRTEENLKY